MKYIINYCGFIIMATLIFNISCRKNAVLTDTASQRVNNQIADYEKILGDAPYGWKVFIFPDIEKHTNNVGGFSLFMKFNNQNRRVQMVSDFNDSTRTMVGESDYDMKFTSLSTLTFSTYNHISILGDPDGKNSKTEEFGVGNRVDIEYSFVNKSLNNDTLYLRGNLHQCVGIMVKASAEEEKYFFNEKKYSEVIQSFQDATLKGLHIQSPSNKPIVVNFDLNKRHLVFAQESSDGNINMLRTGFVYSGNGLIDLHHAYIADGLIIKQIRIEDQFIYAISDHFDRIPIHNKDAPFISPYHMLLSGAYTSIVIPANEEVRNNWPNKRITSDFVSRTASAKRSEIAITSFEWLFDVKSRRIRYNINGTIRNQEQMIVDAGLEVPKEALSFLFRLAQATSILIGRGVDLSKYDKPAVIPYEYRYVVGNQGRLRLLYNGPQHLYASQDPGPNRIFLDMLNQGIIQLEYSNSANDLLVTMREVESGKLILEGFIR